MEGGKEKAPLDKDARRRARQVGAPGRNRPPSSLPSLRRLIRRSALPDGGSTLAAAFSRRQAIPRTATHHPEAHAPQSHSAPVRNEADSQVDDDLAQVVRARDKTKQTSTGDAVWRAAVVAPSKTGEQDVRPTLEHASKQEYDEPLTMMTMRMR